MKRVATKTSLLQGLLKVFPHKVHVFDLLNTNVDRASFAEFCLLVAPRILIAANPTSDIAMVSSLVDNQLSSYTSALRHTDRRVPAKLTHLFVCIPENLACCLS